MMVRPLLALLLCAATGGASAQYGLQWGAPVADRSAQLALAGWTVGLRVHLLDSAGAPLRLIGDHYLTGPGFGDDQVSGGLRLSGGLTVGARQPVPGAGPGLSPGAADAWQPDGGLAIRPYLGLGYSTLWVRSGWGFAADIGLGGLRPGAGVPQLGAAARGNAVEQVLESLRMAPVLQLGVSYAF
jgi:hypothetical protein